MKLAKDVMTTIRVNSKAKKKLEELGFTLQGIVDSFIEKKIMTKKFLKEQEKEGEKNEN
jgi:hypothetical protein